MPTFADASTGVGGVSSFGYSGTIVHTIVQSLTRSSFDAIGSSSSTLALVRRRFEWIVQPNPLRLGRFGTSADGGLTVFRSDGDSALLAVVADHVVMGRVVFPAAGYLEMARAAWCALGCNVHDSEAAATLKR
eukprot:scaffold50463_cov421-Isochrysis_galbana.AAC.1